MFDDGVRGAVYELLMTHIRSVTRENQQIVLMSAVLSNAEKIKEWLFGQAGVLATDSQISSTPKSIAFVSDSSDMFYFSDNPSKYDYYIPRIIKKEKLKKKAKEHKDRFFPENSAIDIAIFNTLKLCRNGGVAIYVGRQSSIITVMKRIIELNLREFDLSPFLADVNSVQLEKLSNFFSEYYGNENIYTKCSRLGVVAHSSNIPNGLKLAVEFADELDNLGVRVADLEKKSDNMKWKGELKYKYSQENHDEGKDKRSNKLEFKLEPKAYIGDSDWTANAKIEYTMYPETDSNADGVKVSKAYVEGPLFGATVTAGRTSLDICQGMIFDDEISGMTANFGSDVFNTNIAIGRYSENDHDGEIPDGKTAKDITADYYGVQFDYTPNDNLALNAGYILLSGLDKDVELDLDVDDNKANLWYVGGKYNFDKNVALAGQYLQNADANSYDKAGSVEIQYKGASAKDAGSWGAYIGYRHLGENVTIETAYDDAAEGQKGLVAGVEYAFAENILGELLYFDGKDMDTDKDADTVYTSLKFKF